MNRREEWKARDKDFERVYTFIGIIIGCAARLIALPYALSGKHPLMQLFVYAFVEFYWYTTELEHCTPFTLNIWHWDHAARFFQLAIWTLALTVFIKIELPLLIGVTIAFTYCAWRPRDIWFHLLMDMILQQNIKLYHIS